MMLECFFASESVSSSDALKFGLFFIHSRHFPAHLTTNFRSAIKSGAGETTVTGIGNVIEIAKIRRVAQ